MDVELIEWCTVKLSAGVSKAGCKGELIEFVVELYLPRQENGEILIPELQSLGVTFRSRLL